MRQTAATTFLMVSLLDMFDWTSSVGLDIKYGKGPCMLKKGDIYLGIMLNVKDREETTPSDFNLAVVEAVRWAVDEVNRGCLLNGLTLGYVILDHGQP